MLMLKPTPFMCRVLDFNLTVGEALRVGNLTCGGVPVEMSHLGLD